AADATAGDIIVTAQKRSERLQDVPISISVVNNALLASTNSRNLNELSGAVPGVQFNGNGGGGRTYLSLRGTTGSALNTGDEPVAIYMDDVYLARGVTIGTQDLLDVGSIEIVRGPQGTLQGRNATAGAILIRSADPTDKPEGYITAGIQAPLEYRAQAAVSGPLGGGFDARLAAGYVNARGFGRNDFDGSRVGGSDSVQGRGVLTYQGDNPLTARIVVDYSSIINKAALFRGAATIFTTTPGALVKTPTPTVPLPADQLATIYDDHYNLNPNTRTRVQNDGLSAKFSYAFGGVDLVSVTGYRFTHVRGTNNSSGLSTAPKQGYNFNDDTSHEVSQEIRLQSSGNRRFTWILGGYYFNESQDYADTIFNTMFTTPTSTASLYFGHQNTDSYAGFADATFNITHNLQIIGGVRYTDDEKQLNGGIQVTNLVTNAVTLTPYTPVPISQKSTTFRGKLVYHPTSNIMLYAGYGTGFRAGGYNDFAVQAPYLPERNKSIEAGAKGDLFDRKLSFSLAGYHNDYTGLQLRAGVPAGGAIITNAGSAVINGFELELTARPAANTRLSANTSYTDATFNSFPRAVDLFNNFVDASGNTLPNAPRWQFFVQAAQDFPLRNDWIVTAAANYRWRDTIYYYFTNQDAATLRNGPGGTLNLRASIKSPDDKWSLAAFVNNVVDKRIVTTDVITFSYPELSLNQPRAAGIAIQRKF
ncbi:TonB-dependent receptor, partial [Sphingomonas bacterium]|uniref:TonB-dependent receptor n=1 Tax=Sphingomonas bacterium TaxID=1895847 RepID=UPI001575FF51